jgi:uncharacterized membrane protein YcfT/poly-gamma-glutamate capsule biosynthesis protein CapA/YwtB (metallophosphatase superfamily)
MSDAPPAPAIREAWGDALKGLLILFVVLWHVIMKSYLQVGWNLGLPIPGAWGLVGDLIWSFMMPLFLLVSGYFASTALMRPWSVVARTRVARFFYLYLLWSLIHMIAMWAFPDFPTLVPRSLAEFVEYLTISPPNTWYLYALAIYFLVAKALVRVPPWLLIGAATVLAVTVSAGYVEVVSNRGSLLFNFVFFLVGLHLAPQVQRLVSRATVPMALLLVAAYLLAFGVMRLTQTETLPGVWPLVSAFGIVMGLAAAPLLARTPVIGNGLAALGRRTLPIYLIHMPLLALADLALTGWVSGARVAVQLVAAVALPVLLTAVVIAASLLVDRVLARDGLYWLFDLPRRPTGVRIPWRAATTVLLLIVCGVVATRGTAIPGCAADSPRVSADRPGQVSIGGTGDLLIHDVGHAVPDDGGVDYFEAVRPWFTQDLVTANLEQVISTDTGYDKCGESTDCLAFRSDPETAQYFAGFDLLNLANNHTGDFGPSGYANTRANLDENNIRSVGERNEISCTAVGDTTVAVIGFAPYGGTNRVTDLRHVRQVVAAAAASADVVVVHAHMGAEGAEANVVTPGMEQMYGEKRGDVVAFSHTAIDAGADLILGHGPHSLRGMEYYEGRLIAYSLGNFGGGGVFGAEEATRYGVYLDATLGSDGSFLGGQLRSVHFDDEEGVPLPDPENRAARLVDTFSQRDFPTTAPRIDKSGLLSSPEGSR